MKYTKDMELRLVNDYIFLYVFGREESKEILLDLVNAVLVDAGIKPIVSLTLKNPVNLRDAYWAKETILDICATSEDQRQFDIEMQVDNQKGFLNRSLYYWAQRYSQQIGKGSSYALLRPVVGINLLDFILFKNNPENHHRFLIRDVHNPDIVLTEDLQLHYIELSKPSRRNSRLCSWQTLLQKAGKEGWNMKTVFSEDKLINRAYEEFERCIQDESLREIAFAREKFRLDMSSRLYDAEQEGLEKGMSEGLEKGMAEGLEKGMAEGIEKGSENARVETARRLKSLGLDTDIIRKATGLSPERIESL